MSYILDALKKSEQARGLRKTLGLLDAPAPLPPLKSIARWPYIIAFVLVLNAGFFAFWLHPWHRGGNMDWNRNGVSGGQSAETSGPIDLVGPPAPIVQTGEKLETAGGEKLETAGGNKLETAGGNKLETAGGEKLETAGGEKQDGQSKTEGAGRTADAVEPSKTDTSGTPDRGAVQDRVSENKSSTKGPGAKPGQKTDANRADQAPSQLSSASPGASGTTEAAVKKPDSSKLPQDSKAAGTKQGPKTSKSQAEALKKKVGPVEQPTQPRTGDGIVSDLKDFAKLEASTSKPAGPAVPKWHELAPEVRDAIPNLIVSMLIFSQSPEDRWININGSKRREGQEISPGLKLEYITPDGAVFSYRGQRFFKGIIGD
jgi:general secretion pathway protein B